MFKLFWEPINSGRAFHSFSMQHLIGILFVVLLVFIIINFKEYMIKNDKKIRYIMAFVMLSQQLALYTWYLTSGVFSFSESLPLYTCRIAILLMVVMLIKPKQWIFDITYFWGMLGALIALITPDTSTFSFPHLMFVQYFVGHGFLLASIVYMLTIKSYTINFSSLRRVCRVTLAYIICIIPINFLVDGNYSYMRFKPSTKTLLDLFPPFPGYVPIIIAIVFALFLVTYLPFYIKEKKLPVPDEV